MPNKWLMSLAPLLYAKCMEYVFGTLTTIQIYCIYLADICYFVVHPYRLSICYNLVPCCYIYGNLFIWYNSSNTFYPMPNTFTYKFECSSWDYSSSRCVNCLHILPQTVVRHLRSVWQARYTTWPLWTTLSTTGVMWDTHMTSLGPPWPVTTPVPGWAHCQYVPLSVSNVGKVLAFIVFLIMWIL